MPAVNHEVPEGPEVHRAVIGTRPTGGATKLRADPAVAVKMNRICSLAAHLHGDCRVRSTAALVFDCAQTALSLSKGAAAPVGRLNEATSEAESCVQWKLRGVGVSTVSPCISVPFESP